MIYVDLPADLNLEDDQGRNIARLSDAVSPEAVTPGAVLVAGALRAWSWVVVEALDSGFVYFRQVSAHEAARRGSLVQPRPQAGTPFPPRWTKERCCATTAPTADYRARRAPRSSARTEPPIGVAQPRMIARGARIRSIWFGRVLPADSQSCTWPSTRTNGSSCVAARRQPLHRQGAHSRQHEYGLLSNRPFVTLSDRAGLRPFALPEQTRRGTVCCSSAGYGCARLTAAGCAQYALKPVGVIVARLA